MKEKLGNLIRKDDYNYIWTFLITMLTMFLAMSYANIVPGGKYFALTGDLYLQYASFGQLLAEKIKEGSDLYYSFHIGMGINTSLIWAFYCFSPIDIFYFFIEDIEIATILILLVKASLSAMFFQLFCRINLKQNGRMTILFSLGYGLCAYQFAVLQMSSLTDGIYFLPLVLILVKKLVDQKKMILLPLVYASLFITNFYCGYIVGLASFGYLCAYLFLKNKKESFKDGFFIFVRFMGSAVVGFLLASFVIIPAVYYVFHMGEGGLESFETALAHPIELYMGLFLGRDYDFGKPFPYLYCGILVLLTAPLYFLNKRFSIKERVTVLGIILSLAISLCVLPLYQFLHMFNQPNGYIGRFSYVLCFILTAIAVRQFPDIKMIKWKKYVLYAALIIGGLILCTVTEHMLPLNDKLLYNWQEISLNTAFVAVWMILLYSHIKKNSKNAMLALVLLGMLELGLNSYLILAQSGYTVRDKYEHSHEQTEQLLEQIRAMDDGVYRINITDEYNKNNQAQYGYYDVGYFSSAYSLSLRKTMYQLGYMSAGFCLAEVGSTEATDMLFGEKYIAYQAPYEGTGEAAIVENERVLSFGYMVSGDVMDIELTGTNGFDNQEILIEAMTGAHYDIYDMFQGDVSIEGENVELGILEAETVELGEIIAVSKVDPENESAYVTFRIPADENRRGFAILSSGVNSYNFYAPMVRTIYHNEPTNAYRSMLYAPHIVEMDLEEDEYAVYIVYPVEAENEFVVKDMFFAYFNEDLLTESYEVLAQNQMTIETFEDGYVKGNVLATEDKPILFLSIPYEEGWKVYVDGQEAELLALVEDAFLGVELASGEHEVEFVFEAPYSKAGIAASSIGVGLWLLLLVYELYCFRRKNK